MRLYCRPNGQIDCLYDETIDLATIGALAIERASYVIPTDQGQWLAIPTTPTGPFPILGPFAKRSDALAAEARWLDENLLNQGESHP